MPIIQDFKKFAFKGNVIDLAVAVVMGTAFTGIVNSIVEALIMPLVGKILPGGNWQTWSPGGVHLGVVLAAVIDFLAIAAVLFVIVSAIKRAMDKPKAPAEKTPTDEVVLLTEIRDLLARR